MLLFWEYIDYIQEFLIKEFPFVLLTPPHVGHSAVFYFVPIRIAISLSILSFFHLFFNDTLLRNDLFPYNSSGWTTSISDEECMYCKLPRDPLT